MTKDNSIGKENSIIDQMRKRNEEKYGQKNDDVISRAYREDKRVGDIWCSKNAEKYLRRFISSSDKSNNMTDLLKAKDYIDRMVEANQQLDTKIFEIKE